jgi:hypothetical protein
MPVILQDGPKRAGPVEREAANQRRRSLRLKGYDYAQAGAYFVTV